MKKNKEGFNVKVLTDYIDTNHAQLKGGTKEFLKLFEIQKKIDKLESDKVRFLLKIGYVPKDKSNK